MVDRDLGVATIVYEGPEGERRELEVQNEHVAYFQDHWLVKIDEHDSGEDVVRRIPAYRVYHVERTVEKFESEVQSLRNQVQSFAEDVRQRVLGSEEGAESSRFPGSRHTEEEPETVRIDVHSDDEASTANEEGSTADDDDEEGEDGEEGENPTANDS